MSRFTVEPLREWLEKNKIFFEVVVAASLSFMGVWVSIQSNKIAETQTKMAEQQALPHLEIRDQVEYNNELKIYDNRIISIYNRGGKLTDFDFENYDFMILNSSKNVLADSVSLPIEGYYDWRTSLTSEGDGLIFQVDNKHNGVKEVAIRDSLDGTGFFNIETYAKLTYTDIFDKNHIDFYMISPHKHKISEKDWQELKERHLAAKHRYYFPRLNAADVIKILNSN